MKSGKRIFKTAVRGQGAFTLLELMVASAILAIVTVIVFGAFTGVMTASEAARNVADVTHTSRFIVEAVSRDLASASMLDNGKRGFFVGKDGGEGEDRQADDISFTGFGRRFVVPGGGTDQAAIRWYAVKKPGAEHYALMRSESPDFTGPGDTAGAAFEVSDRLVSFNAQYMKDSEWEDAWDTSTGSEPPRAVLIEFTLLDSYGREVSSQVLAPVGGSS